jgi:hypothetical protein
VLKAQLPPPPKPLIDDVMFVNSWDALRQVGPLVLVFSVDTEESCMMSR